MKKFILLFSLSVSLLLGITACGHEETVRRTAEVATIMAEQENVKAEAHFWVDTGAEKVLTYDDFFAEIKKSATGTMPLNSIEDKTNEYFNSYNYDMKIDYFYDENDNFEISVSLPMGKNDKYNQLCEVILVDNELYISTDVILKAVETLLESKGATSENPEAYFSGAGYVKISADAVNKYSGVNISDDDIGESKETLSESISTLVSAIKDGAPEVITKDLKVLTKKDGYYLLSMDEKQALIILNSLIDIIDENTDDIVEFLNNAIPGETIDEDDISELSDALREIADSDEWENIKGNMTFAVKGTKLKQEMKLNAEITHSEYDNAIRFGFETNSAVADELVGVPKEKNVIDLTELLEGGLMNIFMGASYPANDYAEEYNPDISPMPEEAHIPGLNPIQEEPDSIEFDAITN